MGADSRNSEGSSKTYHQLQAATYRRVDSKQQSNEWASAVSKELRKLIGPDLTGAQRTNVDYQMQIVATTNGRVITGLLVEESDNAITVQTSTEKVIVPRDEIEEQKISDASMMPEGILQKMTHDEVRDLFAYLMGSEQVVIP